MLPTTDQLVQACIRGDQHAWNQLVERYARLVYSVPARAGLSSTDRDDIFQSVFASLLANIRSIHDGESLPRWLITTANRAVWRHVQRSRRSPSLTDAQQAPMPLADVRPDEMERGEQRQLLYEGLQALGGRCERLLTALFLERPTPTYEAIEKRLAIAAGSIGPTRQRCLGKLAAQLRAAGALEIIGGQKTGGAAERAASHASKVL